MTYNSPRPNEAAVILEDMQEFYSATIEYYDELYPLDTEAIEFIHKLAETHAPSKPGAPSPLRRYLGIGCAIGNLENKLVLTGMDITGIDRNPEMIETAKRRMKHAGSTIRFFEMSSIDMRRFLKAGSFNIIGCLDNMLAYIGDETLFRKFFHDSRTLLAPGGALVLQTLNIDKFGKGRIIKLQNRSSVRVTLSRTWTPLADGKYHLDASLELGSGKRVTLKKGTEIFAVPVEQMEAYAKDAGFASCVRYADFSGTPWSPETVHSVLVFS